MTKGLQSRYFNLREEEHQMNSDLDKLMYYIGCLYLSGYSIVSLQWSPAVSLAAPPLASASSADQCRFWPHVGCCVLLRGVSLWSLVPVWLLCSKGPFRLWVHQHGMISPLSCVPC